MAKQQGVININAEVEVVMVKKTTYGNYMRMRKEAEQKGWTIKAYEVGFRAEKTKAPINDENL